MNQEKQALKIAVFGAGLIGARHAQLIQGIPGMELTAIVDPAIPPKVKNTIQDVLYFDTADDFFSASIECDGVVIATPNHTHMEIALECLARQLPCLIEKPLAADSKEALAILEASDAAGVPVLVGHHRRHHKVSTQLRHAIDNGSIGKVVGAQLCWMLRKPASYFSAGDWRTRKGGGPVWINLIHEIDLLRYFMGEIVEVSAMLSNAVRGTSAEDTGVINMRFANDAIATAILSDTAPSPWHFEGGSGENPNVAYTGQDGLRIFGTKAAIGFPSLERWCHQQEDGHWGTVMVSSKVERQVAMDGEAALTAQLEHFACMISDGATPMVSAHDGLQSVRVVEAIHEAAKLRKTILVKTEWTGAT